MIPDRFQYFLDDFCNFENFTKSWTYDWSFLGPWTPYLWLFLYQNTSKTIRKFMGTSWKILFWLSGTSKISQFLTHQTPICFESFCWTPAPPPHKKIGIYYRFWRTLTMIRFGKSSETHYFDKMQNHKQILMNQKYFSKSDLSFVQESKSAYIVGIYGP